MLYMLWYIMQLLIGYNLLLPLVLFFLYLIKTKTNTSNKINDDAFCPDYAIIVTAYQEIAHIPETVRSILRLKYSNFLCYVVLDDCADISSLSFEDERVILLQPQQKLQGNVRSHFYAVSHFLRQHEYLTIIDSDNLVQEDYLNELNCLFQQGYKAVQGVRNAKNLDSQYACLDAARDIYYHFYDGKVLFGLGSSATLSGSGMAFRVSLFRDCLENRDVSGAGFDKVLQYEIVSRGERIAFAEKAIVYDQKTVKPAQLVNQRARWINTWFRYYKYGFSLLLLGLRRFSVNQLLFGIVLLRPPLFLFLVVSFFCLIVNIWISPLLVIGWMILLLLFVVGFIVAFRSSTVDTRIIKALKFIPHFMFFQFVSLFHSRSANTRSVATKHFE